MKTASTVAPGKAATSTPGKATRTQNVAKTAVARAGSSKPRTAPARKAGPDGDDRDLRVRALAYSYYEARGCLDGHETEDWLRAEAEVNRELDEIHKPAAH